MKPLDVWKNPEPVFLDPEFATQEQIDERYPPVPEDEVKRLVTRYFKIRKHLQGTKDDHDQTDHAPESGGGGDDEYKLTPAEAYGEWFRDDYYNDRSIDDEGITFFESGGVSLYEGDLPTSQEAREIISRSSTVEGFWGSWYGAEYVRQGAADLTGTEAWEGVQEGVALEAPKPAVGWDEDAGVQVYANFGLGSDQIAYTYLYEMHHQEGNGRIASENIYRGVDDFPDVKIGDEVEWGLASFSPDQGTARGFGDTIIVVDKGAKIRETHDPFFEVLTGGQFKVRNVRERKGDDRRQARKMIWLTQVATFDPDEPGKLVPNES